MRYLCSLLVEMLERKAVGVLKREIYDKDNEPFNLRTGLSPMLLLVK